MSQLFAENVDYSVIENEFISICCTGDAKRFFLSTSYTYRRKKAVEFCRFMKANLVSVESKDKYNSVINFTLCLLQQDEARNLNMWTDMVYKQIHVSLDLVYDR